MIPIETLVL